MHVAVIGSGYVGLVAGACLAETGNDVVCVDKDAEKIARLQRNEIPIYEPGLEPMVQRNQADGRLTLHHRPARGGRATRGSSSSPSAPRRARTARPTCSTCWAVAREIGRSMNGHKVVVTKSTVPVGTAEKVRAAVALGDHSCRSPCARNPEFLKEGAAIEDFMKPDRVVIGVDDEEAQGGDGRAVRAVHPPGRQPDPVHGYRLGRGDQVRRQRDAGHPDLVHEPDGPASASWSARTSTTSGSASARISGSGALSCTPAPGTAARASPRTSRRSSTPPIRSACRSMCSRRSRT